MVFQEHIQALYLMSLYQHNLVSDDKIVWQNLFDVLSLLAISALCFYQNKFCQALNTDLLRMALDIYFIQIWADHTLVLQYWLAA